jgi:hypothetical protein
MKDTSSIPITASKMVRKDSLEGRRRYIDFDHGDGQPDVSSDSVLKSECVIYLH